MCTFISIAVCSYVQEHSLSWEENGNVGGERLRKGFLIDYGNKFTSITSTFLVDNKTKETNAVGYDTIQLLDIYMLLMARIRYVLLVCEFGGYCSMTLYTLQWFFPRIRSYPFTP